MSKKLTCGRVRNWLQDRHDREGEAPRVAGQLAARPEAADPARLARAVGDREVAAHLEGCADCRRFREFLSSFGRQLAGSLDAVAGRVPQGDPAVWLASPAAARLRARVRPLAARPLARAWRAAARWAIPAAAAALLAIAAALLTVADGTQAPRLASGARVQRSIRADTSALVEELFSRPLAQGVEIGLAGYGQLEGLSQGDGLQGLGEGEEPASSFAEPLSP